MSTLPQVPEDQEESVCHVLEVRRQELIWDDKTEIDRSVHSPEQTSLPHNTHKSQNSQTTNLVGWKKSSKMVSPTVTVSDKNTVDVTKREQQVSPRSTYFVRPLSFVYVLVTHTTVTWSHSYFSLHKRSVNT